MLLRARSRHIGRHSAKIRDHLKMKPWLKCTADDFRDYLFLSRKKKPARSYIRLQFSALRTFYRFLVERKRLTHDPSAEVQLPKLEKKLPHRSYAAANRRAALRAVARAKKSAAPTWMPLRDAAVLELFYSSGLRLSELAALDVADVDLYTESVRVLGKGRKERVCPVGLPALEAISALSRCCEVHTGPLFINKARRRISTRSIWLIVRRYLRHTSHPDLDQSAQIAPQLRHPHARSRRRSSQRPGLVRPRQSIDHANLYPRYGRTPEKSLRRRASTRVT